MAGILDLFTQPAGSFYNGLLNNSQGFPDVPEDKDADAKKAWQKIQDETDKQNADADRRNAAGLAASSAPPPAPPVVGSQLPAIDPTLAMKMALGQAPATPFGSLAPMAAQQPAAPPVAQGPVPIPQPRPAAAIPAAPQQDPAALPPNSQPTQGQLPPQQAAPQQPQEPSFLSKIGDKLNQNSNLLIGMGAGFAGAPSIGTGISRGLTGASAGSQIDVKQNLLTANNTALVKAFQDAKVPSHLISAALTDPDIKKSLIENYISDRKSTIEHVKSKDMFGNETDRLVSVNPFDNTSKDITGTAASGSAGGITSGGTNAVFAPGVTMDNFNHTAVGDDYIKQFDPEIQAAAKNYLAGQSIPTGRQAQSQAIKMVAQKYGADTGMPADDAAITQRKQWANSLGNTQNGVGLQAKGFQQGLEHFTKLSDNLVKMNLSNGFGLEPVAGVINSAKNLTTDQQELVHKSDVIGQALSREMGNLFSKNGGGVHEAAETKKNVSNSTMSSKSAAGSLEAIDELMQGGLKTLEQRRDELFPTGNAPKGSQFMGPEQQAALDHIRKNIAILKGEQPADASPSQAASVAPTATGPNGHKIVVQNGRWVDAQTGKPVQ
jgi:hypothetical protein